MLIIALLFCSLILLAVIRISPIHFLQPLTSFLHRHCLARLPENSIALPELKALVCAENFSGLHASEIFVASGLIHLFVVSGSHLLILQRIYVWFNPGWPQKVFFLILFVYASACQFNSPVSRSFIAICFADFLATKHLYWPRHYSLLIVGFLTLIIEPQWVQSISLQLSWLAAFVVATNQEFFKEQTFLFKQSLFFFILLPLLIYFNVPSPLVILINMIFTPALEFVLFPLGLLVWLIPNLYPIFDFMIELCKLVLMAIDLNWQYQAQPTPQGWIIFNWSYIFCLHICAHFVWINKKRNYPELV